MAAAAQHGAAVDENPPHIIYVQRSDVGSVISDYRIDENYSSPNVVVWVVDDPCWPFDAPVVPPVVALVDLVNEGEHRSARELLNEMRS